MVYLATIFGKNLQKLYKCLPAIFKPIVVKKIFLQLLFFLCTGNKATNIPNIELKITIITILLTVAACATKPRMARNLLQCLPVDLKDLTLR